MEFQIYRWQEGQQARMQKYTLDIEKYGCIMLLDALIAIQEQDPTLSFRRSCRQGVCGSDAMNVNGKNILACITKLEDLATPILIRPLPFSSVIRDLVVDMSNFYEQYYKVKPFLVKKSDESDLENLQTPEERAKLDGLYECILCGACSTACPSYWWRPQHFLGPAALLQAARFILDTRDASKGLRLEDLGGDPSKLYSCHGIMNCSHVCPKGLQPAAAIGLIRKELQKNNF